MELVYLWVEDYKNIHKQGFNFSPRFNCHYDADSNELTIDENDDYIENFFGDNINVTAIVGKNGSGKSSVFEVLTFLYWSGSIPNRTGKTFFLYKNNGSFYIQCENCRHHINGTFEEHFTIINNTSIDSPSEFSHRTGMPLISFSNCISDMTHNRSLEVLKQYDNFYNGIQPDEPMMKSRDIYDNFNQKFQYILQRHDTIFEFLDEKFIFNNYQLELHIYELGAWISGDELYEDIIFLKDEGELLFEQVDMSNQATCFYRFMALFIISKSEGVLTYDDIEKKSKEEKDRYAKEHIFDKVVSIFKKDTFGSEEYDKVLDICIEALEPSFRRLEKYIKESFKREDYFSVEVEKLLKEYSYVNDNIWRTEIFAIVDGDLLSGHIASPLKIDLFKSNILRCNFIYGENSEYGFLNLSSGEKLFLNILTNYAYTLYRLKVDYKGIMLFDEIELSFHPDWQKRLLDNLLYLYRKVSDDRSHDLNIHMLFSSHSPFLLSDIPKQNIIFLDTDKNGNCKVVDGLKEKKQTFGANIHTLLSDSFFMDDGLMGEFSKGKINEIIEFHKEVEKIKDNKSAKRTLRVKYEREEDSKPSVKTKFWDIQSIIGEDYLKQVIKNHLVDIENILLGYDEAKVEEVKRLRAEADRLEGLS